jgi:hypothetical protein
MAKPLVLIRGEKSFAFQLEKVDRTKLYGYVETVVCDENNQPCELHTIASDGKSIVAKGGTALAMMTHDGLWRTKAQLKPTDLHNVPITPVKSSFDAPQVLSTKVTAEEYLSHNVHLIYKLEPEDDATDLTAELKAGAIYTFPFSYRGGLEASVGFVLANTEGEPFLCVGTRTAWDFVGLQAIAPVVADAEEAAAEDDDVIDFSAL